MNKRSIKCAKAKCNALHKEVRRTLDHGKRKLNAEVKYGALPKEVRRTSAENNQGSVAEGIKNKEQWEGPEFQDTANSGKEKEAKIFTFYRMEEEGERENEEKLVKRELLVSLKGEFYFVKFILNPEEDDVKQSVILGRSFMRLAKGIVDFRNGIITIHPELDPFLDNSKETEKSEDDWDHLLDIDFGDLPEINETGLPPFVCKIGKRKRKKRRALENFQLQYSDVGPSMSNGKPLTQEEAAREELAIDIYKRFSILEEEKPLIETMAYSDKYKKNTRWDCYG
ncbi:hypothetical protein Tco_1001396 [Tanacetum coccineum]